MALVSIGAYGLEQASHTLGVAQRLFILSFLCSAAFRVLHSA